MNKLIDKFINNITIVEIENSSFCNRKCSYCINHTVDRISKNDYLDETLFKKIIDELAEINYSRMVTFHRFNEPFAYQNSIIIERIAYAREKLRDATLVVSTNGDYLDKEYVIKIKESGLNELYIQRHHDYTDNTTEEIIRSDIKKINDRIGNYKGKFIKKDNATIYCTVNSPFDVLTVEAKNFYEDGFDRGGVVKLLNQKEITGPCYAPSTTLTVDYNGNVNMCCNLVSYVERHKDYCLGNVKDSSLLDIYNSDRATIFRKNLLSGNRPSICKKCLCNYLKFLNKYEINPQDIML